MSTFQVRVSQELYESARIMGKPQIRSINQQVEYWAQLGRAGEANPELTISEVENLLMRLEQKKTRSRR